MTATVIDREALVEAAWAQLQSVSDQTAFLGEATEAPLIGGSSSHVAPYTVLYPGAGTPTVEVDMGDTAVDLEWLIQITCSAGYTRDLAALVTRVDAAFYRWVPVLDGVVCGPLKPPPGFQQLQLLDRDVSPHRPYVPLQYRTTVTAT